MKLFANYIFAKLQVVVWGVLVVGVSQLMIPHEYLFEFWA
jgi:hypothetical protein